MSNFGKFYAQIYDQLNSAKDYSLETSFVLEQIQKVGRTEVESILDLGCGTGRHLEYFKETFSTLNGVDRSDEMVKIARDRVPQAQIVVGDAMNIQLEKKFDVVTALFDVLSYQVSNAEVLAFLANVAAHLERDGLAILDFWHLPALVGNPPQTRIRRTKSNGLDILRISEAELDWETATTEVSMSTYAFENGRILHQVSEYHKMRAFQISELDLFARLTKLRVVHSGGWLTANPASKYDWHAFVILAHAA